MMNLALITDSHGFLKDINQWTPAMAKLLACEEKITLTQEHWKVIYFLREYYKNHQKVPAIRLLVKTLKTKYGNNIGNSLYLQKLFPQSPALQAAKIAGLKKPKQCI